MNTTEKWEPLSQTHKILVSKEHNFNTDTLILANFSAPKKNYICADFGTGCGTIASLWAIRQNPKKIYAIELQEKAFNQASQTIKFNNFQNFELIHNNINNYKDIFACGSLDQIACNPPYKALGTGITNEINNLKIARHEQELTLEDLAKSAAYCLKFGGKFFICQRPERLTDVMAILRQYGLEAKRLQLVQQRESKSPSLFLLEARRGGKSGLDILPNLLIEKNGEFSPEMLEIYGDYKN